MKRRCSALVAVMFFTLVANPGLGQPLQRTISVTGQGEATASPDVVTIRTGVVTQAAQASEALSTNNQAVERIMEVLEQFDVAPKDIQTSNFDVRPEHTRGPRGQQQPAIMGYRVTNQVRVRVRNLPNLGQVLDALVRAGSNQISGIRFGIDDTTPMLNQTRILAVADARRRATLYAHAADARIGKVISISEQTTQVPRHQFMGRALAAERVGSVPVAAGEQEVRSTIHMVFSLVDAE